MAKKNKKENNVIDNAELEALVNEGKGIDVVKSSEIIDEKNNGDVKEDDEVEDLIQTVIDNIETIKEENLELSDKDLETNVEKDTNNTEGNTEEVSNTEIIKEENLELSDKDLETNVEKNTEEEVNVTEDKPKKILKKNTEPWYIARAKRECDYYNW